MILLPAVVLCPSSSIPFTQFFFLFFSFVCCRKLLTCLMENFSFLVQLKKRERNRMMLSGALKRSLISDLIIINIVRLKRILIILLHYTDFYILTLQNKIKNTRSAKKSERFSFFSEIGGKKICTPAEFPGPTELKLYGEGREEKKFEMILEAFFFIFFCSNE